MTSNWWTFSILTVIAIGRAQNFKTKLNNIGLIYAPLHKQLLKVTLFLSFVLTLCTIYNLVDDLSSRVTLQRGIYIIPPSKHFLSLGFSSTTSTTHLFNWSWTMPLYYFKWHGFLSHLSFSFQYLLKHLLKLSSKTG